MRRVFWYKRFLEKNMWNFLFFLLSPLILFMNASPNIDMLSISIKNQPFTVIWLRFWGSGSLLM